MSREVNEQWDKEEQITLKRNKSSNSNKENENENQEKEERPAIDLGDNA